VRGLLPPFLLSSSRGGTRTRSPVTWVLPSPPERTRPFLFFSPRHAVLSPDQSLFAFVYNRSVLRDPRWSRTLFLVQKLRPRYVFSCLSSSSIDLSFLFLYECAPTGQRRPALAFCISSESILKAPGPILVYRFFFFPLARKESKLLFLRDSGFWTSPLPSLVMMISTSLASVVWWMT